VSLVSSTAIISIVFASILFGCSASECSKTDAAAGLKTLGLEPFVLFAGSGYSFAGGIASTTINGDIGSSPTATPLSSNPKVVLNGVEHLNANFTASVALDVKIAYNNAMAKIPRLPISGDIGGLTLSAGTYYSVSSIGVSGSLTLDAKNDTEAVFLIISQSATHFAPYSQVVLINGAQPCRVFWVFGSSATINSHSIIVGNMIAHASITVGSGSVITGSLAASSAITVDNSTLSRASCSLSQASLAPCVDTWEDPVYGGADQNVAHVSLIAVLAGFAISSAKNRFEHSI